MSEPVVITSLELENVKRVKAVALRPAPSGLTVIGGRNGAGKTSVLDAIAWALGGGRFRPSEPGREGSSLPPSLHVELSNGLVVERKGEGGALKVIDPAGNKAGQALLDGLIECLALDLPRFLTASAKEKATVLLDVIGVGAELAALEAEESRLYDERTVLGRMRDQKHGAACEMESFEDAPAELVSAAELIEQQQAILARNGERQSLRSKAVALEGSLAACTQEIGLLEERIAELEARHGQKMAERVKLCSDLEFARKSASEIQDESTAEIERSLAGIDEVNRQVRTNLAKADALAEAAALAEQYEEMTRKVEDVRSRRMALLDGAQLPLDGLGVEGSELVYRGRRWDNMSGSDQLRVATAIVRRLKPSCGFVLVDKLEQMDTATMAAFSEWATGEGLQVIATRVSTGDECSVVIEDGYVAQAPQPQPQWQKGEF